MTNALQTVLISGLLASFVIAVFLIPIGELNNSNTYNADIDTTNLSSLNQLNELQQVAKDTQDEVTENSAVSSETSLVGLFNNAFVVGKFIITGGPVKIVDGMIRDFVIASGIPWIVYVLISGILFTIVTFALVKIILGRG